MKIIYSSSYKLSKNYLVQKFLGQKIVFSSSPQKSQALLGIGWGFKENTKNLYNFCQKNNIPFHRFEEGFLSYLPGANQQTLSFIIDKQSMYYYPDQESDYKKILLNQKKLEEPELLLRSKKLIEAIKSFQITKLDEYYSQSQNSIFQNLRELKKNYTDNQVYLKDITESFICVVDQTLNDQSIIRAKANTQTFETMFDCARKENPGKKIFIKVHPKVLTGEKKSSLERKFAQADGVIFENVNPFLLLRKSKKVYCVSSQLGFEALLLNIEVICFGLCFYAQLGLTDDRHPQASLIVSRSIEQLFATAYILYPKYFDIDTKQFTEIESVVQKIIVQKKRLKETEGVWLCVGFSLWKKNTLQQFLKNPKNKVIFFQKLPTQKELSHYKNPKIVIWSYKILSKEKNYLGYPIIRVEDGFLRSVGLGSDLIKPSSLVFESLDLHFYAHLPSTLENLLNEKNYEKNELERATRLLKQIKKHKISKYNFNSNSQKFTKSSFSDKKIILVIGQVEGDQSLLHGACFIKNNLQLLKAALDDQVLSRDQFVILFKEHPDVLNQNRKNKTTKAQLLEYCDHYIDDRNLHHYLQMSDEIHVMTSLVGFEALLYEKKVVVWAHAFYAGWGLTFDKVTLKRRERTRTLQELVAATLIDYPVYFNWENKTFTTPEFILQQLHQSLSSEKKNRYFLPKNFFLFFELFQYYFSEKIDKVRNFLFSLRA